MVGRQRGTVGLGDHHRVGARALARTVTEEFSPEDTRQSARTAKTRPHRTEDGIALSKPGGPMTDTTADAREMATEQGRFSPRRSSASFYGSDNPRTRPSLASDLVRSAARTRIRNLPRGTGIGCSSM
jgi:hypothetical protein